MYKDNDDAYRIVMVYDIHLYLYMYDDEYKYILK